MPKPTRNGDDVKPGADVDACGATVDRDERRRCMSAFLLDLLAGHGASEDGPGRRERTKHHFPKRDRSRRHHYQVRNAPWTMFFYGFENAKKQPAAPSGPDVARSAAEFLFQEVGLRP